MPLLSSSSSSGIITSNDNNNADGEFSMDLMDANISNLATYDGHGALSAGASSRLLYDYPEKQRSEILDYLFLPNFGASIHLLKVEIGGDSQSTDGTEASHMHYRDDLNCNRGYEFWLLEEAKKRNPSIVTYALSWAVPHWVGNDTFFSEDNIHYQIAWLECVRSAHPTVGPMDYIGIWNERTWNRTYVKKLRTEMDAKGFSATKIILPDGWWTEDFVSDVDNDPELHAALLGGGIGLHYPCKGYAGDAQKLEARGLKFFSSEDYSTQANWAGASCWGRSLNQNYVSMGMTSTIAWSLIWSVYPDFTPDYFGNGLMYAFTPWSGHYVTNTPIWTTAQYTQFTAPGWKYLNSTMLPLSGSLTALIDGLGNITIIAEKLEGDCLRCKGPTTESEQIHVKLPPSIVKDITSLSVFQTNKTHHFLKLPNASIDNEGILSFHLENDTIMTFSTLRGKKGVYEPAANTPFQLPYSDDFEDRDVGKFAKYLADNGGSFEISKRKDGKVLRQMVHPPPKKNAWVLDCDPISVIGENTSSWNENVTIAVDVYLDEEITSIRNYAGVCLRTRGGGQHSLSRGLCLEVNSSHFRLTQDSAQLGIGPLKAPTTGMRTISLSLLPDSRISATVEGIGVVNAVHTLNAFGRAAIISSFSDAAFDNLWISRLKQ